MKNSSHLAESDGTAKLNLNSSKHKHVEMSSSALSDAASKISSTGTNEKASKRHKVRKVLFCIQVVLHQTLSAMNIEKHC